MNLSFYRAPDGGIHRLDDALRGYWEARGFKRLPKPRRTPKNPATTPTTPKRPRRRTTSKED